MADSAKFTVYVERGDPFPLPECMCKTCWLPSIIAVLILINSRPNFVLICNQCATKYEP